MIAVMSSLSILFTFLIIIMINLNSMIEVTVGLSIWNHLIKIGLKSHMNKTKNNDNCNNYTCNDDVNGPCTNYIYVNFTTVTHPIDNPDISRLFLK